MKIDLPQVDGVHQQEHLPLDFKRKLEAWERMRGAGAGSGVGARQCDEAALAPVETCRRDNSTEKKVCSFDLYNHISCGHFGIRDLLDPRQTSRTEADPRGGPETGVQAEGGGVGAEKGAGGAERQQRAGG